MSTLNAALSACLIVFITVAAMEGVAWASHRYVMHGFGWAWHRDHHEPHDRLLEKNDRFALFGAALSIGLFALGSPMIRGAQAWWPGTWLGLGVLIYGAIYTLIHDGLVHQRWFRYVPRGGYAKRLVQAHKLHHATTSREGGVSFGFVFARDPARLKRELRAQRALLGPRPDPGAAAQQQRARHGGPGPAGGEPARSGAQRHDGE